MGFYDLFKKKTSKYDSEVKENVPRLVYGVPDYMRKKHDEEKSNNKYDVNPRENIPSKVYGIKVDRNEGSYSDLSLEQVINKIMRNDPFWTTLLKRYFASENLDEVYAVKLLSEVSKDKQILNEFTKYLAKKSYDIENSLSIDGITAKSIADKNPNMKAIEVYAELKKFRNK